jgi:Cof subfamily protein (haloacid dehalogenase superfamily)
MLNPPEFDRLPAAIAIDLDGTLLNSRTELSSRNRAALEACIDFGIPVIIATARSTRTYNRILTQELVAKCSCVCLNGALVKGNPPLSGYYREPLSEGIIRDIVDCALAINSATRINIEIDGYIFGANWDINDEQLWQRNAATPDMVLSLEEALKQNPCKVSLGGTDIPRLYNYIKEHFDNAVSIVIASGDSPLLNITSPLATKPAALRRLLSSYSITLDRVLAFGDDYPDMGMLQECGMSVAMANALPEVKAVCRFETASNDEDGVALVLEKMLKEKAR